MAKVNGTPFKALLMETILGGCGAELSHAFLGQLAQVLKKHNICVIVDGILTGGRIGPRFATTFMLPKAFQCQVQFITLGKCF